MKFYSNGSQVGSTDTSVSPPSESMTHIDFGGKSGSAAMNGHLAAMKIFNEEKDDAFLVENSAAA